MYASMVFLALAGSIFPPAAALNTPEWKDDYKSAYQKGTLEHKPLALFFGQGSKGWTALSTENRLSPEVQKLLKDNYVCVYVDTKKAAGRKLATSFDITEAPGLVLTDHTAEFQAYSHEGSLSNKAIARNLQKYADPTREVEKTESETPTIRYYYTPVQYSPVRPLLPMSGFSGGSGGC